MMYIEKTHGKNIQPLTRHLIWSDKNMFNEEVIKWLLEENNPIIAFRTRTELLDEAADTLSVRNLIYKFLPEDWYNNEGKYLIGGTLTKPYLPKETVSKPSKWVTFYTLLAEKEKNNGTIHLCTGY